MTRAPLIIDSFAGGGGASTGIELALGRSPDVAINHNPAALALHAANHPETLHLDSNVWDIDPVTVTGGRPVGLLWASPDCKHHSKAKGAAPKDRNIRDLAWVVVRWARFAKPDVILLENVEEFRDWGPVDEEGKVVRELAGLTFDDWCRQLRQAGYRVQHRELRACDFGAPTIRKRLFVVARRDGRPIVWPKPTHGDPDSAAVRAGRLSPWRTAAECIDWTLPCPSIFASSAEVMDRHGLRAVRPLAQNTLARVARGMKRFVLDAERPFLVNVANSKTTGRAPNVWTVDDPVRTLTTAPGFAIIAPALATFYGHGEGRGVRSADLQEPLRTVTVENRHAVIAPILSYAQQGGAVRPVTGPTHTITASSKDQNQLLAAALVQIGYGERTGQGPRCLDPAAPLGTVVAGGVKHAPVAVFLAQQNSDRDGLGHPGRAAGQPFSTITGTGSHQTPVAAWLAKYYGTGDGATLDQPCHTVTTADRFGHVQASIAAPPFAAEHDPRARQVADLLRAHGAWDGGDLVTLEVDGATFVIIDIGLRMLTPRELYRAQGFPEDYVIEGHWTEDGGDWTWHPFPKDVQIACCGNSVCPPLAAALAAANCAHLTTDIAREQEAAHG